MDISHAARRRTGRKLLRALWMPVAVPASAGGAASPGTSGVVSRDDFTELRALSLKLLAMPQALAPMTPPIVYGYVRTNKPYPEYVAACADLLTWWSTSRGWRLGVVFRDDGVGSTTKTRPGFTGLLDVLRLPDSAHALVIDQTHLSGTAKIARQLTADVRRTGATVRVLTDELAGMTA